MKKGTLIMVIGLVLMLTAGAFAQGFGPRQDCDRRGGKRGMFFQELKLTDKQQDALSAIRTEQMKKMVALRSKLKVAKIEMSEILADRNFSKNKAKRQIQKINGYKLEMAMVKLNSMDKKRKIFTDEQWKLISKRIGKRGYKGHHGYGRGMGRRGFGPERGCGAF